jgi:hypothetical protein
VRYAQKALSFPQNSYLLQGKITVEWREKCTLPTKGKSKEMTEFKVTRFGISTIFNFDISVEEYTIIWDYHGMWNDQLVGREDVDDVVRSHHFFGSGYPHPELTISILTLSKPKKVI